MPRRNKAPSADLCSARDVVEKWRSECEGRRRVPQDLWDLAVPLAKKYGVNRFSVFLKLKYDVLKRRTAESEPEPDQTSNLPEPTFVELPRLASNPNSGNTVVEIRSRSGEELIIRSSAPLDLFALTQAFFSQLR
jgi:hypothetical protein